MEQFTQNLSKLFKKVCVNSAPSFEMTKVDGKYKAVPRLYRREDLSQWAKEAFERGENYFYYEPVNPDQPYGKQHLTKPKFVYQLVRNLTEEEYETLVKQLTEKENA